MTRDLLCYNCSMIFTIPQILLSLPNLSFGMSTLTVVCGRGVTCDAFGHVIGLDLSYKNISGSFDSIFDLHHIQHLNLAGNNFNTTLLSYGFDKLPNLTHLNLSISCFHGQIPVKISFSTRLVSLDLSNQDDCYRRYYHFLDPHNGIYDYDPLPYELQRPLKLENPDFKTLIKNLRNLTELNLDGVDISFHSIKWCKTTSLVLSKLQVLGMSNCGLKGPLCSSLSKLAFLSKLFLGGNPISSLPPNFLEISSRLVSLSLANCGLSGYFPIEILLLPKIQSIDLSANYDLMGELPEFPSNSALRNLSLSETYFGGKVPESIGNLKLLTDLTLSHCNFSGPIPSSIANLSQLVNLDLSGNNLSGLIPPFHRFGVPNLAYLHLGGNRLSGSISSSLFTLPSLQVLSLEENQLDGKNHDLPNASSSLIEELNFGKNYLTGPIPKFILQLPRLEWLFLGGNSFSSMKLSSFVQLKNLRDLDLSDISLLVESNNISINFPQLESLWVSSCNLTEVPGFFKTQDKLVELDLSNNHIHGVVPNWLWKSTLQLLQLSFNPIDFSKQLPLSDANFSFPMLRELYMGSCNISAFPEFLRSQEKLQVLDLSNNRISGAIPNWVWKKSLFDLNLANNHLSSLDQLLPNQSFTSS
ncbi:receptor-like protein 34 [Hibiscus syriacus]|uniref:receptor-like protein 34 n=1 Tax=Hibiscus syriacus TaxID=106335 RepID=UPI001924135F|nr:receptor-like protein 34 [Hibiscus syriacus]